MTFVDTNILIDIAIGSRDWREWSAQRLAEAGAHGALLVNDVVFAELSALFIRIEEVEAFLHAAGVVVERTPRQALFLAARAHRAYRRRGGIRIGVLPDFFIGADALVRGAPLLTRDATRYRTYFPGLDLIAPDTPLPPGARPG